jgi:copper chaperone CopZ
MPNRRTPVAITLALLSTLAGASAASADEPATTSSAPATTSSGEPTAAAALPALRSELTVPVATEPTFASLDKTAGQQWHRVTFRLDGSMCPACLIQLEDRLRKLPAINYAKVNREDGHERKRANVVVIYDGQSLKFERIKECVTKEAYRTTDVDDKLMTEETK